MLSEVVRTVMMLEMRISIPDPNDALDYLRLLVYQFMGVIASIPPVLARDIRLEVPVFVRGLDGEVEMSIQSMPISPLLRIRTSREILERISGVNYVGVTLDSGGTSLKMYRGRDEAMRDRERLLILYRIFLNSGVEIQHSRQGSA